MDMQKDEEVTAKNLGPGASTASCMSDYAIEKRTKQVLGHLALEGKVMLDIGCGNGLYTIRFANTGHCIIGVDISELSLQEARKNKLQLNGSGEFIRACAENLPFQNSHFDVVLAIETLDHVQNQERALVEAGRVLRKDGYLVAYVPNRLYPLETHGFRIGKKVIHSFHGSVPFFSWAPRFIRKRFETARIYSRGEIASIMEKNGFIVREVDYMYPPLDRLGSKFARAPLRKVLAYLEGNSLTKRFGMSIFVLAQKN